MKTTRYLWSPLRVLLKIFIRLLQHELRILTKLDLLEEFGSCRVVNSTVGLAEIRWKWCLLRSYEWLGRGQLQRFLNQKKSLTSKFGACRQPCACDISGILMCFGLQDPIKHLEMDFCLLGVFVGFPEYLPCPYRNLCWLDL